MSARFLRKIGATGPAAGVTSPARLVRDSLESYGRWRVASAGVRRAYEDWRAGDRPDRHLAFAAYQAALDREEQAARVFDHDRQRAHADGGSWMEAADVAAECDGPHIRRQPAAE